MNHKQRKHLREILGQPSRGDVRWSEVEALLRAMGANLQQGKGSRLRVHLGGVRAVFHVPHPPVAGRGMVDDLRRFLESAAPREMAEMGGGA